MESCPRCGRANPPEMGFCAGCGTALGGSGPIRTGPPPAPARPAPSGVSRAPIAAPGQGASRGFVLAVGLLGLLALAGATGYKIATQPGRVVPPVDPKVRAAPPPSRAEPDDPDAPPPPRVAPAPPPAAGGAAPAKGAPAKKTPAKPAEKKPAEKKTPELGPPPSQREIRACIDKKKSRIRACANQAAERMEFPGGGTARATMNPNGKLTNVHVPGGGYFASCTSRVIRGITCRAYKGGPIPITYPMR